MSPVNRVRGLRARGVRASLSGAAVLVALVAGGCATGGTRPVRNVILIIGDGFGPTTWETARVVLAHERGANPGLKIDELIGVGHVGLTRAAPLEDAVTDSAAAATTLATGTPTRNERIGTGPDGEDLPTLIDEARSRGLATGVVTTTRVTHATPAAFLAAMPRRYIDGSGDPVEAAIAAQIAEAPPDVLLGGGARYWLPAGRRIGGVLAIDEYAGAGATGRRADGRDLIAEMSQKGFAVVADREGLAAARGTPRLLGLFSASHLPYVLDRRTLGLASVPALADLVEAALATLSTAEPGFVLVVEGGRIDHAGHINDVAAMVREVEDLDAVVGVALDFASRRDDTLVLLTADHETGGVGFSYYYETDQTGEVVATEYVGAERLDAILDQQLSFVAMQQEWQRRAAASAHPVTPADVQAVVETHTGIRIDEAAAARVLSMGPLDVFHVSKPADRETEYPARALGRLLGPRYGIAWSSGNHTGGPVLLIGFGPGSEHVRGYNDRARAYRVAVEALGWSGPS